MELEDQVCSLELAKKLKELGVKQESILYWHESHSGWKHVCEEDDDRHYDCITLCSTFSVAELGEMLPEDLCINGLHPFLFIGKGNIERNKWTIGYSTLEESVTEYFTETLEADGRAKLLIYLIENKLINI